MSDLGHEQTDKELKKIEDLISKEYAQAARELEEKMKKHFADFDRKDAEMKAKVDSGEITKTQYQNWRVGQIATGDRWREVRDSMVDTLVNKDKAAAAIIQGNNIKAYGDNMNYGTYEIEHGSEINTGFSLYDVNTVKNLMKEDPKIIPMPKVDIPKDELWNRQKLTSAVMQGILQGESMAGIAHRLSSVAAMGANAAIRNARTYTTAAENKGRLDSYERAEKLGIKTNKKWIATLDDRTRMEHRHLDNMVVAYDADFEVDGYTISYPGDPSAEPEMIYNCRCTLVADIPGINYNDERNDSKLGDMTYEEWKNAKGEPIEAAEPEPAAAIPDMRNEFKEFDTFKSLLKDMFNNDAALEGNDLWLLLRDENHVAQGNWSKYLEGSLDKDTTEKVNEILSKYVSGGESEEPDEEKEEFVMTEIEDRDKDGVRPEDGDMISDEEKINILMNELGISADEAEEYRAVLDNWNAEGGEYKFAQYMEDKKGPSYHDRYSDGAHLLEDYIDKAPKFSGEMYRGLTFDTPEARDKVLELARGNNPLAFNYDHTITSWSTNMEPVREIYTDKNPIIFVTQNGNSESTSIRHFEGGDYYSEIIASRDAQWEYVNDYVKDGIVYIEVREPGQETPETTNVDEILELRRYTTDDRKEVTAMYADQVKNYSTEEKNGIRRYVGDTNSTKYEYEKINGYLRDGGKISKANESAIDAIDKAIENFEVKEAFTARRGINLDAFNSLLPGINDQTPIEEIKNALIGVEFADEGYMSTSWNTWGGFSRDALIEIDVPAGKGYGCMVGNLPKDTKVTEDEFILKRGTHLDIYDIDFDKYGRMIIHSRIVGG